MSEETKNPTSLPDVSGQAALAILKAKRTEAAMLNLLEDLEQERNQSREEAARTQAIIRSIADGVLVVDSDGRIRTVNPAGLRMFGLTEEGVTGRPYSEVCRLLLTLDGQALEPDRSPVSQAIRTGEVTVGQAQIAPGDERLPVSFRVAPVRSGERTVGAVAVFRDIADEMEIDRAKTEFVSIASHQLRTPLNGMRWWLESLANGDFGPLAEGQAKAVADIYESCLRMSSLIDTLLNLSRIESGRLSVKPEPCFLPDLVQEIWTENQPAVAERRIALRTEFDPAVSAVPLDRSIAKTVMQNLLTNAIKYSRPEGEVSVAVRLEGEEIISSVRDAGYGIPADQQAKIFSKMFRASNVVDQNIDGSGLGLYISKTLLDGVGGRIWFESKENEGTTFSFAVPAAGMAERHGDRTLIV